MVSVAKLPGFERMEEILVKLEGWVDPLTVLVAVYSRGIVFIRGRDYRGGAAVRGNWARERLTFGPRKPGWLGILCSG